MRTRSRPRCDIDLKQSIGKIGPNVIGRKGKLVAIKLDLRFPRIDPHPDERPYQCQRINKKNSKTDIQCDFFRAASFYLCCLFHHINTPHP